MASAAALDEDDEDVLIVPALSVPGELPGPGQMSVGGSRKQSSRSAAQRDAAVLAEQQRVEQVDLIVPKKTKSSPGSERYQKVCIRCWPGCCCVNMHVVA